MFIRREWFGRRGTGLNKFSINGGDPVEVVNNPTNVTEQGDPIDEDNLNDLENRIYNAFNANEQAIGNEVTARQNGDTTTKNTALALFTTASYSASFSSDTFSISVSNINGYTALGVLDVYVTSATVDGFFITSVFFDRDTMQVTVKGKYYGGTSTVHCKILYVKNTV